MNYIEFEIGGKVRGFKLGLGFFGDVLEHFKMEIVEFGKFISRNPYKATPAILFHAHRHDNIRKGKPIDFTVHDVEDWIDEIDNGANNKNIEALLVIMLQSTSKHLGNQNNSSGGDPKKK